MPENGDQTARTPASQAAQSPALRYREETSAYRLLIILFFVWLASYASFHSISFILDRGNSCRTEGEERICPDVLSKPWGEAVRASDFDFYRPIYDRDLLLKFFSPADVEQFILDKDADYERTAELALKEREEALADAAGFLRGQTTPGALPAAFLGAGLREGDTLALFMSEERYRSLNMGNLIAWYEKQQGRIDPERIADYEFHYAELLAVKAKEDAFRLEVSQYGEQLDHDVSFLWLYHDSLTWGWIPELIFWSILGVLIHTIVALMTTTRAEIEGRRATSDAEPMPRYNPRRFIMLFPRLILAPVVAIVVLALVVTGLTDLEVTISNLPFFLLFAFLAGFASERFTAIIRNVVNHLIPRFEINPDKFDSVYGSEVRRRVSERTRNVASNFRELEEVVKDEVATSAADEIEKRLKRRASGEPKG